MEFIELGCDVEELVGLLHGERVVGIFAWDEMLGTVGKGDALDGHVEELLSGRGGRV